MKTIIHNGNTIQAPGSTLTGMERVYHNGVLVSSKRSILGARHQFSVDESGESALYDVRIGTRWTGFASCTIRRNGELLFSDL